MPTPFDVDNTRDDDVSSLPVDAQALYHRLTRDGADSRDSIARIDQRLQGRIAQLSATQIAPNPEPESLTTASAPRQRPYPEQGERRAPRYQTMRRWGAVLATATVVIAFVVILSVNAGLRSGGVSSHQTPAGVAARTTGWIDLTRLDYSTSFSANDLPAMAPSNPQVVYETMAQGIQEHLPGYAARHQ